MIKIFDQEIKDGLEKAISESSVISYASEINLNNIIQQQNIVLNSTRAGTEDVDLFYIDSILVSVGWNKNDDIFDSAEVWKARHTPVNKQLNILHSDNYIVGHIISSLVTSENKLIAEDIEENDVPQNFDIVVGSVIYKKWQDQIKQETIDKIIAEIKENKWFVSMECLFPTFDYGLISAAGEQKIIPRNEESSFLTKYLTRYGGTGKYQDYKIGRVLRGIIFSGKGLVKNPANPRSIIFTDKVSFAGVNSDTKFLNSETYTMAEMDKSLAEVTAKYEKQVAELTLQVESAKTAKVNMEKEAQAEAHQKTKAQMDELNKSISDLQSEIKSLKDSVTAKEAEVAKSKKDMEDKEKEAKTYSDKATQLEKEILTAKRVSKLVAGGVAETEAITFVEKWQSVSEEQFTELATLYTKKAPEASAKIEQIEPEQVAANLNVPNGDNNEDLKKAAAGWFGARISKKQNKE